jgi:branched-chain amino acid transport system substrate-binding protein
MLKTSQWLVGALLVVLQLVVGPPATAADKVFRFGCACDLTKVYTFAVAEIVQAQQDYVELLNMKGGVNGYRFEFLVEDSGNEPQRALEIYERFKGQGAIYFDGWSTPVGKALTPRVLEDKVILGQMFVGRGDAVDGHTFPYVFPMGATYWQQMARAVGHVQEREGGTLRGKKVAFVYIDSPFGREPLPVLDDLARRLEFEFKGFPVPSPATEQSAAWTGVRAFRPDWVIIWFAGPSTPAAVREALRAGFPVDHLISVSWIGESDMKVVGEARAKGVQRIEGWQTGRDIPIVQEIVREVYEKAKKGHGPAERVGWTYYNIGMAEVVQLEEAVRVALRTSGEPLTGEKLKRAFESFRNFDAKGLRPPLTITAEDHGGGQLTRIGQWDGSRFVKVADWKAPFQDVVAEQVKKGADEFRRTGK